MATDPDDIYLHQSNIPRSIYLDERKRKRKAAMNENPRGGFGWKWLVS